MRRGLRVLTLACLVGGLGVCASLSPIGFGLEEDVGLGWLFRLRGARPAPEEAVVVRFDRDALARLRDLPPDPRAWPEPLAGCAARHGGLERLAEATEPDRLPRAIPTCLIEELNRRGAAVIAFDVLFRRDPSREAGVADLAEAIRKHGRVVLLERAVRAWLPLRAGGGRGGPIEAVQADVLEGPHGDLARAAIATAPYLLPRAQGTTKVHQFWAFNPALPVPVQLPTRALEAMALPALDRLAAGAGEPLPAGAAPAEVLSRRALWFRARVANGGGWARLAERVGLSTGETATLAALERVYRGPETYYLGLYGPPGSFASLSVADLLAPERSGRPDPPVPDLRGRVVFVGYQELAIPQAGDSYPTAFQNRLGVDLSGVEIAATAFSNLLHGEALRALPEWARVALVGVLGVAFSLASCLGMAWRGLAAALALAAAYAVAAALGFAVWHVWLPVVVPLLGLLPLAVVLGQVVHYLGAARWLGVYAPRQVSRQLLQGREIAAARPQRREVTVMLTDIVGFTALAERSTPEAVTDFVNRHFTMLTRCVEAEGGTVAQFIGDSVMAFWGAPDPQPDHAARACRAALAIERSLEAENALRQRQGEPPVRMRIGINTGPVTAGNVGAPGRSNYGIVGDAVNTTQRIEQLAKEVCLDRPTVAVLASATTRAQAGDGFRFADAGARAVRGRQELVRIFRLDAPPPETAKAVGGKPRLWLAASHG